jgi:hypothetical protein
VNDILDLSENKIPDRSKFQCAAETSMLAISAMDFTEGTLAHVLHEYLSAIDFTDGTLRMSCMSPFLRRALEQTHGI